MVRMIDEVQLRRKPLRIFSNCPLFAIIFLWVRFSTP